MRNFFEWSVLVSTFALGCAFNYQGHIDACAITWAAGGIAFEIRSFRDALEKLKLEITTVVEKTSQDS